MGDCRCVHSISSWSASGAGMMQNNAIPHDIFLRCALMTCAIPLPSNWPKLPALMPMSWSDGSVTAHNATFSAIPIPQNTWQLRILKVFKEGRL
jgi:hypothetical protein